MNLSKLFRVPALGALALGLAACSGGANKVKIAKFSATQASVPQGMTGELCYGVENAKSLDLNPPVEKLFPAVARCFVIAPLRDTTYRLTAHGADGSVESKSVDVRVTAAAPKIFNLKANAVRIRAGQRVRVCFQVANAKSVKAGPGKFDAKTNCLEDRPKNTTTYRITALGGDREKDEGSVTVKVR